MSSNESENSLIIASNRLPIVLTKNSKNEWRVKSGSGGLVTALAPVLSNRGGNWIGWTGTIEDESPGLQEVLAKKTRNFGYSLKPVNLTKEEKEKYYEGFSNQVLWPLFHDMISHCNFEPEFWHSYQRVNKKFAQVIVENLKRKNFIWIHDYHLMCVAKELRDRGLESRIAFFLHIPFPPLDIFLKLPWRFQILHALLEYDVIGFQTLRDRRNFIQCVRTLVKRVRIIGRGQVVSMNYDNRELRIGAFEISIDFKFFAEQAASREVSEKAWYIHEDIPEQQIILGVDRLDYTKGIIEKLNAYRSVLRKFPELQQKTTLIQVVVPSRRTIPKYAALKIEIEQLVGEINGQFTQSGWVPIHYIFRELNPIELLAYYRTAEIVLITPLKDGMNLVAKEYCACNLEENGVLILSEFAGAAAQLHKYAFLVNPFDIEGVAGTLAQVLRMRREERHRKMQLLRRVIRKHDIFWWVESCLKAAFAKDLTDFPLHEDYTPSEALLKQAG